LVSVFGRIRVHSRSGLAVRLFFRPIFGIGRSQEWDTTIWERRSQQQVSAISELILW
jgi:hypothetical protein